MAEIDGPGRAARSAEALRDQCRLVERFIANALSDGDYAALGYGRGYARGRLDRERRDYGQPRSRIEDIPHTRRPECSSAVCLCPSPETSPRFEAEIIELLDRSPAYLHRLVWPAIRRLPSKQQMILHLHCKRGMSFEQVARWKGPLGLNGLGLSDTTIFRLHREAFETVARRVWLDDGQPNWAGESGV